MVYTHLSNSHVILTMDLWGQPLERWKLGDLTSPVTAAQDPLPPAGAISTWDVITPGTTINTPGNWRVINLTYGAHNRQVIIGSSTCYLYRTTGTPGWVAGSLCFGGMVVAGVDPSTNNIVNWTISGISTTYFASNWGKFISFQGNTTIKAVFANDIYVKCL